MDLFAVLAVVGTFASVASVTCLLGLIWIDRAPKPAASESSKPRAVAA